MRQGKLTIINICSTISQHYLIIAHDLMMLDLMLCIRKMVPAPKSFQVHLAILNILDLQASQQESYGMNYVTGVL